MPDARSMAPTRAVVAPTFSRQFIRRFAISLLLTGFDTGTLVVAGPSAYRSSLASPLVAAIFAVLFFGLFASLARVWFLTFRTRNAG
jgi:uncharacterized membrane protein YeiB